MQRRHAAGNDGGTIGLADRACHIKALERAASGGKRIDRRSPNDLVAVAPEMIGAQLVRDDEQEIRAVRHDIRVGGVIDCGTKARGLDIK